MGLFKKKADPLSKRARALNAGLNVGLRRGSVHAAQDHQSCDGERIHSAGKVHDLYYSKVSAKILPVIPPT